MDKAFLGLGLTSYFSGHGLMAKPALPFPSASVDRHAARLGDAKVRKGRGDGADGADERERGLRAEEEWQSRGGVAEPRREW